MNKLKTKITKTTTMKKYYLPMVSGLAVVLLILAFVFVPKIDDDKQAKVYTSQEIWDMQYQKKKEKRKTGYSKLDKPDKFAEHFQEILQSSAKKSRATK